MDDQPTNQGPKKSFNQLDLSQLESFSFGTQWTQDKPEQGGQARGRDDRPNRDGPRDNRKDRRGFKRPAGAPGDGGAPRGDDARPPRPDRPFQGDRPPRPEGAPSGAPGGGYANRDRRGPGGPGGGDPRNSGAPRTGGDPRGGGDRRRDGGRPSHVPAPPYISPYFDVTFYPEDNSFAALAKTIRASCRTFELFDIAKTVIGKNDRFVVVLERKPSKDAEAGKRPFYVSVPDGLPFETEEAAVNHVMQNHLDKFFSSAEVETDPPKGSFQVINKCGVTGELLGPPNYHLYNNIVQQHHAARLARMPFDTFRSRIETVRDPEVVNAWLESMKKVTRYMWVGDGSAPAAAAVPAAEAANAPAEVTETAPDAEPTEDATAEVAEVETPTSAPAAATGPTFDSLSDAKVFLLTQSRDKVVRTYEHGRFHGHALALLPDSEIKRAVEGSLERQQRFPLDTANALRGRLRREGFTIFKKGSKGVSFVCAVKRKFRVPGQTFADSLNRLITFIEVHPMVKVSELPEKFLQIVLPAAPASAAPSAEAETPAEGETPVAATVSEADQRALKRMQLDLRWLVMEGYVTEFIDGSLFAAAPMPEPKAKSADAPASASDESNDESDGEDDGSESAESESESVAQSAPEPEPAAELPTEPAAEAETVAEPEPAPAPEAAVESDPADLADPADPAESPKPTE